MNKKPHIFLDIDGVMVVGRLFYSNRTHPEYDGSPFDKKCVEVLNAIIGEADPVIIISSDWKDNFNVEELNNIFEANGIVGKVSGVTSTLWKVKYTSLAQLEECRADEIALYVIEHELRNYVAIDDLDLSPWLSDNFVHTPRSNEGIKQSGIKQKIINKLKTNKI